MDKFKRLKEYLDTKGIDLSAIPEQDEYKVPARSKMASIPGLAKKIDDEDEDEE